VGLAIAPLNNAQN